MTELKSKPFPCSGIRLQQLKDAIYDLVDNKVLEPGDSEYTSPCFFVTKKPGEGKTSSKGRLCYDYRKINSYVKTKQFPLTNSKNFFNEASRFKIFCVIDIQNAFLSIPLTENAKKYLAIITPFGTFCPTRTPFGLKTSPSAFCYALSKVISDLNFIQYYMDDILIGATTNEEMIDNLIIVMSRLVKFNLKIRLSKTAFFIKEAKVLGVIFNAQGKRIDPAKTKAILNFGPIDTLKKTQTFLGMLAFISSFIPHFSTACYPIYSLLKDQKSKKFILTEEALTAYEKIKEYVKQETMLYHPDFNKNLYLAVDASQVGIGSFLYQIDAYPKTEQGKNKMLEKLGFEPEQNNTKFLIPGISPGKNTPIVTDFMQQDNDYKKFDTFGTLTNDKTMTEKIESLQDTIFHVRPICWFSRCFTTNQVVKYTAMEKEFMALVISLMNFKDYIEASPICFVLSDSQPVLWAIRHKDDHLKLSRWLLKIFELNINIIITHVEGAKNVIADFLSRLYYYPENKEKEKDKDKLGYKSAQHVTPTFNPLQILSMEDITRGFNENIVQPCLSPELCHLNVNGQLYKNLGPFKPEFTCHDTGEKVYITKKLLSEENYGFSPQSLQEKVTAANILIEQKKDLFIKETMERLEKGENKENYFLQKDILCKKFKEPTQISVIVLPKELVPYLIAMYHFQTHGGPKKLFAAIRLKYFWKKMYEEIREFCKGCVLCSIFKHDTTGKSQIGVPRFVQKPLIMWQMDVVKGFPTAAGYIGYINFVDMYSGYTIPVPLKTENSVEIAKALEEHVIKPFGVPMEISSDNAQNLQGPSIRKLLNFYNIQQRLTVPYSPESHALVEIQNRYLTELTRIFSDQFQCHWYQALTLSSIVLNSVPKHQLKNHSPYFLIFGQEPYCKNDFSLVNAKYLDLGEFVKETLNNKIYIKLVREYLLIHREKQNKLKNRKYKSFPRDSLVLIRDLRPKIHKKSKPIFYKLPEKIISEYHSTVYTNDILGRVRKHSKNNIKMASERTQKLFGKLPKEIQLVLGEEFNLEKFEEIKTTGIVPLYLEDIDISVDMERITRGTLPKDTHLLERPKADNEKDDDIINDEDDILDEFLESDTLLKLNNLHSASMLTNENLSLKDVSTLHQNMPRDNSFNIDESLIDIQEPEPEPVQDPDPEPVLQPLNAEIDTRNILPEGTTRRRHVRFDFPNLK